MSFSTRSYGQKTLSVYGGAGGRGTRISSSQMSYAPSPASFNLADGMDLHVSANEKATMQNLNDRLASYLEKVRTLEKENDHLDKQIREWYQNKTVICHDYTSYFAIIDDLKDKIRIASRLNAKTVLDIDNAKLAADDFKMKYENELAMRMAVEADISGLKRVLDDMNLARMDLESQYEALKDELIMLKRNHEEEMVLLRSQMGGQVNVAVDATPSTDLNQVMTEIRDHYEGVIAKNRKELESWYQNKISAVEQDVITHTEILVTSRTEIKDLKSTLQRLQIELQSHLSMKASLEGTLAETQARYAAQLASLQNMVTSLEAQLSQLHANISSNKQDYDMLLDLKTRLELEIAEYRRLLDGEDDSSKQVVTKVITVVETVVDGKVVESSKTVDVDVDQIE
ncbi:keratin, type I cytoskeletal 13-like [Seriola lalandi dorsalis]|uniref:Keratin 98 n=1 Tax=Seriola lalandi dorsalis TaxID=1841481 RepID=A0A3B4WLU8_SERLL|nr:keratin, type I cytoskeletal 13-like [Seriola lalandi dorsalis]XP_023277754.1 keratin, type I cytoskeletal 13-like [Seriola lalandi dorsalis]XP_056227629.1 keratin 98 [Seriola aureovittata]